ncbi:inositol 1,4,5-trisphosphate receptor-interacting protein-like 1 [Tiliqua scincoides]|uniref:inositol 1,4,5-trisphosphate receptor-interacting protein-like 1 n=1 Tax=Tiliqua scincoides TaxID=71010 RepID=UPI003461D860
MALCVAIGLTTFVLLYKSLMVNDDTDLVTQNRLHEYEERMKKEMGHLQTEFDQQSWSWGLSQVHEDWMTTNPVVDEGTWDGWPYVGLIIIILFGCCRHTMEKEPSYDSSTDSSSTTTNEDLEDDEDDTDLEPECYSTRQKALEAFYDHHVEEDTSDLTSMCDFVESFVNDLLDACRGALPDQNPLLLLENCIGVDSAFEGWHTQKASSKAFCVLVPISPPKGHSFHVEMSDVEGAPSKHGHILVEMECLCKRERLLGDVVCSLHHPNHHSSNDQGPFFIHDLCTSSHLDVDKAIHWFQALVAKAWESLSYKYKLDLVPQPSNTSCRLKLMFKSGRTVFINIILGVQLGDTLVFLATQGAERDHLTGAVWQRNFAVQELLFFKWVSQRLPEDSCYLKCLQILIFFKESSPSSRKEPVLSNYHYKTCLMHLLLCQPLLDWEPEDIAPRIQDMLQFMHTALQEKYLQHFVIGNICLPIQIPIPQALRSATPLNLFKHLEQDRDLHAKAMKEFVEVVEKVRALWSEREE